MTHPATCKYCRRELSLEIDDDCPPINISVWKPLATCNQCADLRMSLLKLGDQCEWVLGKCADARGSKAQEGVMARGRQQMTDVTKRIMTVICDAYRVQNRWEESMVDAIFQRPDKVRFIISHMRKTVQGHRERATV